MNAARDPSLRFFDAETASGLELHRFLSMVQGLTCTDLGFDRLSALLPLGITQASRHSQPASGTDGANEARERRELGRALQSVFEDQELVHRLRPDEGPRDEFEGLRRELARRRLESDGPTLVLLAAVASGAADVSDRLQRRADQQLVAALATADGAFTEDEISQLQAFAELVHSRLDARGEVKPDATPELRRLTQKVQHTRQALYRGFEDFVSANQDVLGEETLSAREGRLTVLLPAGHRGRIAGLRHGRSSTGRSYYFEPMELVEVNNEAQEARSEEAAERAAILRELSHRADEAAALLARAFDLWALLDEQQAIWRYASSAQARYPALVEPEQGLRIAAGRHPLLDPKLLAIRERTLGDAGHRGEVVPLDLEIEDARALVITGPNAGGKTVALKTVGLFCLLAGLGFPVPCDEGSRLPVFDRVLAVVGDEQDMLRDQSTFSARLLRLHEVWLASQERGPRLCVLLDEVGSGTNPQEGVALMEPLLEQLVNSGATAILTTHMVELAARAHELERALCAGMEFDPEHDEPRFRLRVGPPAGSHALALARRLGLAEEWIDSAHQRLSQDYGNLLRLLEEVEREREQLESERTRLERLRQDQEQLNRRLAEREEEARERTKRLRAEVERELVSLRRDTRKRLEAEVAALQEKQAELRRRLQETGSSRSVDERVLGRGGIDNTVQRVLAPAKELSRSRLGAPSPMEEATASAINVGGEVRHRGLGWRGVLEEVTGDRAVVRVGGKKLRCGLDELVVEPSDSSTAEKSSKKRRTPVVAAKKRHASDDSQIDSAVNSELNLIGQRVEPALDQLDAYLDRALLAGHQTVRIVHGHGTGRLREAVREALASHPLAQRFSPAPAQEGGNGATKVELRGAES